MYRIKIILLLLVLYGCTPDKPNDIDLYSVSVPKFQRNSSERITKIIIELEAATVYSINFVPFDWGVEVSPPVSGMSKIEFFAGHGVSYISDSDQLDNFLSIRMCGEAKKIF